MTSHYGNPLVTFQPYSMRRNWRSPTFPKEAVNKNVHDEESCHEPLPSSQNPKTHIFGTKAKRVSSDSSFEETTERTMSLSIHSESSWTLNNEKYQASFSSIGLPSDYPCHRKNNSLASSIVSEGLGDFAVVFEDLALQKELDASFCGIDKNPIIDDASSQQRSTSRRSRHRRQRTELSSTDSYQEMKLSSKQKRRQRNLSLCAKDFQETILEELFPDDFSVEAFRY